MNNLKVYATAAVLGVAGIGFTGCDREDDVDTTRTTVTTPAPTVDRTDNDVDADGDGIRDAADKVGSGLNTAAEKTGDALAGAASNVEDAVKDVANGDIRIVVAEVTEAAMTKGGLDDAVERFVDADRNRIGESDVTDQDLETLDGLVADLQKSWKAKYNTDFDIDNIDQVYPGTFLMISKGELGRNAAGAEVDVDVDREIGGAEAEVDVDRKSGVDAPGSNAADRNLNDPGRNVASVTVKASHGLPDLKVPFIREAGGWKIDVPDSVTGPKLRQNLLDHLTNANNMKDKWPATAEEAYRAMSHHVLLAVMDKPVQK